MQYICRLYVRIKVLSIAMLELLDIGSNLCTGYCFERLRDSARASRRGRARVPRNLSKWYPGHKLLRRRSIIWVSHLVLLLRPNLCRVSLFGGLCDGNMLGAAAHNEREREKERERERM